jgi:pimeloyl-ACP methyl ester carboxylesterase
MLARLLRRLLLGQLLIGALLGWQAGFSFWLVAASALLLPFATTLLVILVSGIKSRAAGANLLWWRSLTGEYWAAIRIFWLKQTQARKFDLFHAQAELTPASPATVKPPIPVLLVHGYLCNHRVWDSMTRSLRRAGHPVTVVNLEPIFAPIDSYAPRIEQAVLELCRQTDAEKVALIGHSMGGLAIRAWMRAHGTKRVARVITLGTPHAGTQIARHTRTPNGRQMAWQSDWLQELCASETDATRSLMRIALTPQDNIVYPQREQVLEGVPVTVFDGLGHLELCLHSTVIAWVLRQLAEAPITPLA